MDRKYVEKTETEDQREQKTTADKILLLLTFAIDDAVIILPDRWNSIFRIKFQIRLLPYV